MLELAILGVLAASDLHGYEVKRRIQLLPGGRVKGSFGALYPALSRLEDRGHIKAVDAHQTPRPSVPMSGSLTGEAAIFRSRRDKPARSSRRKKVYGITDAGRERLRQLLVGSVDDDRAFPVQVAFCAELTPAERLDLFERRRAHLVDRLDPNVASAGGASGDSVDFYRRSLVEWDGHAHASDLAWLDRLIEHERDHVHSLAATEHDKGASS